MEIKKFKKLLVYQEDLPKDFNWDKYTEETGRPIPQEVRNGDVMSLLFVSWVRAEVVQYKRGED